MTVNDLPTTNRNSALAFFGAVLVLLAGVLSPFAGQADPGSQEDRVKAAFIYQFTNYIEWPDHHHPTQPSTEPFVISVIGKSPLVEELIKLAETKTVKGRPITVVVSDDSHILPSPIVIVNTTDETILAKVVAKLKDSHSLIVSQGPDFAKKGAMINFFVDQDRLRFEINRTTTTTAKFHIGSQLLSLARLVD